MKCDLQQSQIKRLLHYNQLTGEFIRVVSQGNRKAGSVVGRLKTDGYIHIRLYKKDYLAHRLAFLYVTGDFPKNDTDHKNHIRNDNRWSNLREATRSQNNQNASIRVDNTSGFQGVGWHDKASKWRSQILAEGKNKHLGYFTKLSDAVFARLEAEAKYGFHINHGK